MDYEKFLTKNSVNKEIKCRTTKEIYQSFQEIARKKHMKTAEMALMMVLDKIEKNPIQNKDNRGDEKANANIVLKSPEAIVYTVPISGVKVVVAPNDQLRWIGLCVNPENTKEVSHWHAENPMTPPWAKTAFSISRIIYALSTRVEIDGLSYFNVRHENINVRVSAKWYRGEFVRGAISTIDNETTQKWYKCNTTVRYEGEAERDMSKRHFNHMTFLRRFLTMLCRAHLLTDGGIERQVTTGPI